VVPFENIHVVPFLANLLDIKQPKDIDGDASILAPIIKVNKL